MTQSDFYQKWLHQQAPDLRQDFIADVQRLTAPPSDSTIRAVTVLSSQGRGALAEISIGPYRFLIDAENLRELSHNLMETALASEMDAAMLELLQNKLDMPLEHIAGFLKDVRATRNADLERRRSGRLMPQGATRQ